MRKTNSIPRDAERTSAVNRPRNLRGQLRCVTEAARQAHELLEAARQGGRVIFTDAAAAFVEQQLMQSLVEVVKAQKAGEAFDAERWQPIFKTLGEAAKTRSLLDTIARAAAEAGDGKTRKLNGAAVAARMREILGLPPAPPPRPLPIPPDPMADTDAADATVVRRGSALPGSPTSTRPP